MTHEEMTRDETTGDEITLDEITGDEITRSQIFMPLFKNKIQLLKRFFLKLPISKAIIVTWYIGNTVPVKLIVN
jgi:hypothetical protein